MIRSEAEMSQRLTLSVCMFVCTGLMDEREKSVLCRRRSHVASKLQVTEELLQDLHSRQLIGPEATRDIMARFIPVSISY